MITNYNELKVFMLNNDLIIKQDEKSFVRLKNFMIQSFQVDQSYNDKINYHNMTPEGIIKNVVNIGKVDINFSMDGVALDMEYQNNTFDYREELIKEIYKDLQNKNEN